MRCINSVLQQEYNHFEIVLIDDGSTDNTKEVIRQNFGNSEKIRYIFQENQGRCIARNTGIKNANGEWICFLDSDDVYFKNHLMTLRNLIVKYPTYYAFATEQLINGCKKKYLSSKLKQPYYQITLSDNIRSNPIQLNQLCYAKEIKILFPEENIPISEDWLFIRQLTLRTPILKTNIITTEVTEHEKRTMKLPAEEITKWNTYTTNYFIKNNVLKNSVRKKILLHNSLLCANIMLSHNDKKQGKKYLRDAMLHWNFFLQKQFYNALYKLIFNG